MTQEKQPPLDVQAFLNEHGFSPFQWLIFGLCFLVVLVDGFDTAAIGFIAPSLIKEWGVDKSALAPVLSAALVGLAAGALLSGPLADWMGRKKMLIGSVLLFGVACTWSAFSAHLTELTLLRFVTGVGLGAAMPNAVTLMSEFCPDRRRAFLTNAMFCGFPLGAALGGFLASWMIPNFGWRSVLELGGVVPLALCALMAIWLPESVRHMISRSASPERIREALRRISTDAAAARSFTMPEVAVLSQRKIGIAVVLSPNYLLGSVMLWVAYFMGLVIFYGLINWMPVLFKDAGIDLQTATLVSALFPLGGCGAIVLGWLMDRFNADRLIALAYALTSVSIYAMGRALGEHVGVLMTLVFVAGTLMNTAQSSMPALAAAFYPTQGRATGVSWMLGLGRLGGIAGSFLVAELARRQVGLVNLFTVLAIPGLIAALAVSVKHASSRSVAVRVSPRAVPAMGRGPD